MRNNWVGWAQGVVVVLVVALVASLFLFGMVGGTVSPGPAATPAPEATKQTPSSLDPTDPQPGVPTVAVDDHETWTVEGPVNPDRQLEHEATSPTVDLPAALGDDLEAYWTQTVQWDPCGGQLCASVLAPLDWENPDKAAVKIVMRKVPSADPTRGPLFVNPGGPGLGGQDFAVNLGPDAWAGYDIVGWDPRGSGESTSVECGTTEQTDEVFELDSSPDDDAEKVALEEGWAQFAQQCRDASGELLDHITTIENARDLDLLRHLLGAETLNYVGVSYGTYVGAVYAELFPDRAGRLVLDSAVDITRNEEAAVQSEGFELALRNYATWCAKTDACPLGDDADDVVDDIANFLDGLDSAPQTVGERTLTQGLAATGVAYFLYSNQLVYPALTYVLTDAMDGKGADLLNAADQLNGRGKDDWEAVAFAFPAILCVDRTDVGIAPSYDKWEKTKSESPVFAPNMGVSFVCQTWTADASPQLKLTGKGAPPILVVGTTGDSATPYEHAVSMAEQLEPAVLLTFEGAGHGSVTSGNKCLGEAVTKYLVDGTLPKDGATCS